MATKKKKDYFLPKGYQEQELRHTMASDSGVEYWDDYRVGISRIYQYYVYSYAGDLVEKYGIKSVVDVGCGPAPKLALLHERFPHLEVNGVDQPDAIGYCKKTYAFGNWYIDDFENPDPKHPKFKGDLVVSSDVIEHVMDPDKLLDYCKMRLNKGGYILLSTPDRDRLHGKNMMHSGHPDHVREWNFEEFAKYLDSRGFNVIEHFHQPGMLQSLNKVYIRNVLRHVLKGRPKQMDYNQIALIQPKS